MSGKLALAVACALLVAMAGAAAPKFLGVPEKKGRRATAGYSCTEDGECWGDLACCVEKAQGAQQGTVQMEAGWFWIDHQLLVPANMQILGRGTDDPASGGTIVHATNTVQNGCSQFVELSDPNWAPRGDMWSRIGFVLGDNSYVAWFTFVALDTKRWQPFNGDALCGGAVFETPGCASAYCKGGPAGEEPEYTLSAEGSPAISGATVEGVFITGVKDSSCLESGVWTQTSNCEVCWSEGCDCATAPQTSFFAARPYQVDVYANHDITIKGVTMLKSWADGINVHGNAYNIHIEDNVFRCNGDDNIGLWSSPFPWNMHDIFVSGNKVSQTPTTNPAGPGVWGDCVAIYGAGYNIWIMNNACDSTVFGAVKMSVQFDDANLGNLFPAADENDKMFPPGANSIYVVDTADASNAKPRCVFEDANWGYSGAFAPGLRVNNCPAINAGWDTCPDACFVKPGCDASMVQFVSGFKGDAWYCLDGSGAALDLDSSDDEWDPCCIRSGCGHGAAWNQDGVWGTFHRETDDGVRGTWTCSGEGTEWMQWSAQKFCDALTDPARGVSWFVGDQFDAGHVSCAAVSDNVVSLTTDAGGGVDKYFWFQNDDWTLPGAVKLSWGDGQDYWLVTAEGDGSIKLWCASGTPTNPTLSTPEMTAVVHGVLFPSEPGQACLGYDSPPR